MNNIDDGELGQLIRDHVTDELDTQWSRVERRIAAELLGHRQARRHAWISVASVAAIVLISLSLLMGELKPRGPIDPPMIAQVTTEPTFRAENISESVDWETIDEGVVVIDGNPMLQLRQQRVQHVQWFDPRHNAWIEMTVPQEQIVHVALQSN